MTQGSIGQCSGSGGNRRDILGGSPERVGGQRGKDGLPQLPRFERLGHHFRVLARPGLRLHTDFRSGRTLQR